MEMETETEMETGKPTPKRPRRFAPLNPQLAAGSDAPRLQGIVFDVDGTLWYVRCDFSLCVLWCGAWNLVCSEAGDFPRQLIFGRRNLRGAKQVLECEERCGKETVLWYFRLRTLSIRGFSFGYGFPSLCGWMLALHSVLPSS